MLNMTIHPAICHSVLLCGSWEKTDSEIVEYCEFLVGTGPPVLSCGNADSAMVGYLELGVGVAGQEESGRSSGVWPKEGIRLPPPRRVWPASGGGDMGGYKFNAWFTE